MNTPSAPRLQKLLADRGAASRRGAADLIRAGRVTVDGAPVREPGARVPADAAVALDGRLLPAAPAAPRTILLHKPRGYVCTRAGNEGRTVFDLLRELPERLVPAGRLDKDSEGLLLLSTDGDLVLRLTHPRHGHRKTYRVTVSGPLGTETLERLNAPAVLDGRRLRPAGVRRLRAAGVPGRTVLEFTLHEGHNRQIRRLCEAAGLTVHRLVRTALGPLSLRGLPVGAWRELTPAEHKALGGAGQP